MQVPPHQQNRRLSGRHGRRLGWLRHLLHRSLALLGSYRSLSGIDWTRVRRLVFVCRGNICRSPFCERRARMLGVESISCGLEATDGRPAFPDAVAAGRERGVELADHRARSLGKVDLAAEDLVIGMEPWHLRKLRASNARAGAQLTLIGLWGREARPHIEDPYGLSEEYFQSCFQTLEESIDGLLAARAKDRQQRDQRQDQPHDA